MPTGLNTGYLCDIIFLENPSKYSDSIKNLAKKYNIYKHFICNENIEGHVFQIFCNKYKSIIESYKYIAMLEADVVLDKESIHESMDILNSSSDNVGLLSIDLHLNNKKYYNLPINDWVPKAIFIDKYKVGVTGFQFIIFKKDVLDRWTFQTGIFILLFQIIKILLLQIMIYICVYHLYNTIHLLCRMLQ
jgi:hypothetical protein